MIETKSSLDIHAEIARLRAITTHGTVITQDGTFIVVDPKIGKSASGRTREEAEANFRRAV